MNVDSVSPAASELDAEAFAVHLLLNQLLEQAMEPMLSDEGEGSVTGTSGPLAKAIATEMTRAVTSFGV